MIIISNSQINSLKTLYNGKKIPLILPIIVNIKLISNFKEKANHFNDFFASQFTPISNHSALPNTKNFVTNVSLSSIQFKEQDILKIIRYMLYLPIKKVISNSCKIITQFRRCQYVVKFSKELSST